MVRDSWWFPDLLAFPLSVTVLSSLTICISQTIESSLLYRAQYLELDQSVISKEWGWSMELERIVSNRWENELGSEVYSTCEQTALLLISVAIGALVIVRYVGH